MKKYIVMVALLLLSCAAVQAADAPAPRLKVGELVASKVLFLGNSITLHGPAPSIGWTGNWGMAASSEDKDYVHLVTADIVKAAGGKPQIKVRNIADFERGHEKFDIAGEYKAELAFQADVIVVAIGENLPELASEESRRAFATAFALLLGELKKNGHPVIFVRSSFWPNPVKDEIMRQASADVGATFIDISKLGAEKSNAASSERQIEHAGVAAHPGDKGMREIANAIFAAIRQKGESSAKQ